jgi:dolichol-phosphate mannosyltransferase
MPAPVRSVFFVPVYDQIDAIRSLIEEIRTTDLPCDELLLVNNGSRDGSEDVVHESGFAYIDIHENRGLGFAFQTAVDWALARDFDVFGVMAGNGKMLPGEMHRVLDPITEGRADYVTGSRYLEGGASPNLPKFRDAAIPIVNAYVRALYGVPITDATCGYAAYTLDLFRHATFDWRAPWLARYGFEFYLRGKVLRDRTIRWLEVPVTMRYPKAGPYSKIPPLTGWVSMLAPWIRARIDGHGFTPLRPQGRER